MNKLGAALFISLGLASGCGQKPAAPASSGSLADPRVLTGSDASPKPRQETGPQAGEQAVAVVNGRPITLDQLHKPMIEAYGLNVLLQLVQLELARDMAKQAGATVSPEDIAAERQRTLETLFGGTIDFDKLKMPDEEKEPFRRKQFEALLAQFLESQRVSMPEFDMVIESSACLRKIAELQIKDRISENDLQEAFRIKYGEKVHVRHIQVSNMQELAEVRRRLDEGQSFEEVARALSRDTRSRELGGDLRPFSRAERLWPDAFKFAAFDLKNPGDLSDPVQTGESIHVLKLVEKIAPQVVKFEDHKDILREELQGLLLTVRVTQLRKELADSARANLTINHAGLRRQYQERMDRALGATARNAEEARRQMQLDPGTPANQPDVTSDGRSEVARPPATRPGQ